MSKCNLAIIEKIECLRQGLYDVTIKNEEMAKASKAGQFLHIDCGGKSLLRRPISICDVNGETLRFIFEVRGEGTDLLKDKKAGEFLSVLGPLGNGFSDTDFSKKAVFVGGGIGIFPLLMHAKKYGKNAIVLLGFRNKDFAVLVEDFEEAGCTVKVATDDGSLGHKGFVTDFLKEELEDGNVSAVFACGPSVMLTKTAKAATEKDIFCEVSMEERMGCGIGACLVCACKVKFNGEFKYLHVCKDGPVFNAKTLALE